MNTPPLDNSNQTPSLNLPQVPPEHPVELTDEQQQEEALLNLESSEFRPKHYTPLDQLDPAIALGIQLPDEVNDPPQLHSLGALEISKNDPDELLKDRYLCRGGGLLLAGPTGIGKSSFALQCAILWSLQRKAFEITPRKPLKSLIIQAENDFGDMCEMRNGIYEGLQLTSGEQFEAGDRVIVAREDSRTGVNFFIKVIDKIFESFIPDILWIDPVLAYIGADASAQKDVSFFLRNQLNPRLNKHKCACVIIHHTNKPPTGKEKSTWTGPEMAYMGSGSIEWANWARAVLAIRSIGSHKIFELHAGKRGSRLQWITSDDPPMPSFSQFIAHAKQSGSISWRIPTQDEIDTELQQANQKKGNRTIRAPSKTVLALVQSIQSNPNQNQSFHTSRLSRELGLSKSAVQHAFYVAEDKHLITYTRIANEKFYHATSPETYVS